MIDRVTDEVIAGMRGRGDQGGPGSQARQDGPGGPSPTPAATRCAGRMLVIAAGDAAAVSRALAQASDIRGLGVPLACLVPGTGTPHARGLADAVTSVLGPAALVGEADALEAVACADVIVIPALPLHLAARVALLAGDDILTRAILTAVAEGKRVYAAPDWPAGDARPLPVPLHRQADDYLKRLREYGVLVVEARDLAREIERGLRALGLASGGRGAFAATAKAASAATPATPAAITAVAGGGSASASPACSTQSGECSGCGKCVLENPAATGRIVEAGASRIAAAPGVEGAGRDIAPMIDHTLLKADATVEQIKKLCEEAKQYNFASVCINPANVSLASSLLKGTPVKVCTVIGFPLGATTPTAKAIETRDAIANGADEVDMVINVGALKSGDYDLVKRDIEAVVEAARGRALVKVIIEAALLTDEEKVKACLLAKLAGADFVKTSTGFGPGGATVEDVRLMRKVVGSEMGIKAAGGIRDLESARKMIEAGATRIGASASVAIVKGK